MTETKINLSKKGNRCRICTGCGRCFFKKSMHVVSEFVFPEDDDAVRGSGEDAPPYLIIADIGTTTIAMQLRRVKDGQILNSFLQENPQRQYGADVLSRIEAAGDAGVKEKMRDAVREALAWGIRCLLTPKDFPEQDNIEKENCKLVIAANTTMVHLLMDYDTNCLGQYPFIAENLAEIRTVLFGLKTLILPGISAFVGGDIVAGITALSMQKRKEITLLLDLGTNGEIVLGNKDRLLATSTAAGPAFEGSTDTYGTDLMALVAKLMQEGIVDENGLLAEPYFETGITIGGTCITRQYIRSLQMAKAAICTGITIAASKYGLKDLGEIDKVFLAGGMGYYLDPQAAVKIGLLPKVLETKVIAVGNAALEGAFRYGKVKQPGIAEECGVFNLAEEENFAEQYIANMSLMPYEGTVFKEK